MPEKSDITFLIFACVIISWPLRMPPRSRPMITSTIAISTRVKPFWIDFIFLLLLDAPLVAYFGIVFSGGDTQVFGRPPDRYSEHMLICAATLSPNIVV